MIRVLRFRVSSLETVECRGVLTYPALAGYTGGNATVNVIRQRPGFDSTIIVAGSFGEAGSLTCQSICAWDTTTRQWSSFGGGLQGVVGAVDFAGVRSSSFVSVAVC